MFHRFREVETAEIHLATGFQNALYEHPAFPAELHRQIESWCFANALDERKSDQTDQQFVYTTRKKALGPFKRQLWDLDTKDEILADQAQEDRLPVPRARRRRQPLDGRQVRAPGGGSPAVAGLAPGDRRRRLARRLASAAPATGIGLVTERRECGIRRLTRQAVHGSSAGRDVAPRDRIDTDGGQEDRRDHERGIPPDLGGLLQRIAAERPVPRREMPPAVRARC